MIRPKLRNSFVSILIVLSGATPSIGQPPATSQAVVDLSTPKAAVRTMLAAVEQADSAAMRNSFFAADPAANDLVGAYADLVVAGRHLRQAAREKFATDVPAANPASVRDGSLPGGPGPEDEERLANAKEQIDGDTATVQFQDGSAPIKLRRAGTLWQIDLADYAAVAPGQLAEQTQVNRDLAAALNDATDEITAGKYASAQEAESAVQQKIHAVIAPQLKNLATTNPATSLVTNPATKPGN